MNDISQRLLTSDAGQPISKETFTRGQQQLTEMEVLFAIGYVETRQGAEWIYQAELKGLRRPTILARAIQRLDDFDHTTIPKGIAIPKEN